MNIKHSLTIVSLQGTSCAIYIYIYNLLNCGFRTSFNQYSKTVFIIYLQIQFKNVVFHFKNCILLFSLVFLQQVDLKR